MKKSLFMLVLSFLLQVAPATAAVRWNPIYGFWEGNVCMNNYGWQFVYWQPIGSMCTININGMYSRGIIVNL